ncbi:MAG: hypothetical protein ACOVJ1_02525 [Sediminibacterium sp.]
MMELQINKLPTLQELYAEPGQALKTDHLAVILNQQPPVNWIKTHPFIKGYNYLPIDKIEFLLKRIFKRYRIEILREGTSFNGVYVVVRVHYLHPVTNEWDFHDGIGAVQLQTAKGTSPADLININNGALSMAYPIAKTIAIKDACDHFGTTFGSDLNRKDTIQYSADAKLADVAKSKEEERLEKLIEKAKDLATLESLKAHLTENLNIQYEIKWNQLSK